MKSIVEEASSIVKAVEAAWIRADKPAEFTVKVFEEPEKNFFGMVTKSAKIALLYKEVEKKSRHQRESRQTQQRAPRAQEPKPAPRVVKEKVERPAPKERAPQPAEQPAKERTFWTDEMIESTRAWLNNLLTNLGCQDIQFELEPKRYYLSVSFEKQVRPTKNQEQVLFRSCAYIIMQMLRTKMKKQLRGLKVVLKSPA